MKPNSYKLMCMAVEEGVAYGIKRAYKHNDNPSDSDIKLEVTDAVITHICEWFTFPEES